MSGRLVPPGHAPSSEGARLPPWQPAAALGGFALLLHFVWEMLHAPLYRGMAERSHWGAVLERTRATGGDVVITWAAYALVAAWARDREWVASIRPGRFAAYLGVGLAITIALEWWKVHVQGSWTYAEEMPVVLGVGVSPLLQWLVLPPLVLWLARRHIGWGALTGRGTARHLRGSRRTAHEPDGRGHACE